MSEPVAPVVAGAADDICGSGGRVESDDGVDVAEEQLCAGAGFVGGEHGQGGGFFAVAACDGGDVCIVVLAVVEEAETMACAFRIVVEGRFENVAWLTGAVLQECPAVQGFT